jgi:hypothetical protein
MAKFKIRVDKKTGMTYFPKENRDEGFVAGLMVFQMQLRLP